MTLVSKAFSDIITFSRASNATRVAPNGLIQYAPHNLLLQSQTFDNASWSKGASATVTANSTVAPDGTVTADTLVCAGASVSNNNLIQSYTIPVAAGDSYTLSVWMKVAAPVTVVIRLAAAGDMDGGALVCNVTTQWQRFTLTRVYTATSTSVLVRFVYQAIAVTVDIWGAQLTVGPDALDYTPTTTAAVYGPRFDYDPVTLENKGLLIEEQRTNVLVFSEQLDQWSSSNGTVVANATVAPNGTLSAEKLYPTVINGNRRLAPVYAYPNNTFSVFLKAEGWSWGAIEMQGSNGVSIKFWFNLAAGVIGGYIGTGYISHSMTSFGNGWYRCVGVAALGSGAGSTLGAIFPTNADVTFSAPSATNGIYVWGAQVEAGAFATSYIPTTTTTLTRAADIATVNTLSPWYSATEGSLYAEVDCIGVKSGGSAYNIFAGFSDGTASESIYLSSDTVAHPRIVVIDNGTTVVNQSLTASTLTANTNIRIAGVYKNNDFAVCYAGGDVGTDLIGTVPTVTKLNLGDLNGVYPLNGHIRRIAYFNRRLSNNDLQAITA